MLSTSKLNRLIRASRPRGENAASQQCDLCGWPRTIGGHLAYRLLGRSEELSSCHDCRRALSRRVDVEGVLGG